MPTAVRRYVRSLGLDAYVVGGAVRDELLGVPHADEDFLVPGVDHAGLRAALEPHGRVEEMEVHGQLVGVRLFPRDPDVRALAPAGIELTPPRAERSTGPGHRDFAIVSGADIAIAEDMARRDFTVNAIARRLADGSLVDPFGGLADLARRILRTVSRDSFREDPLRLLRGLRFVSQLGFEPAGETFAQMRMEAAGLEHVSAERIGGGIAADGMGELSKLLLGAQPARALRLARDAGVLERVIPEIRAAFGYRIPSARQPLPLDEHVFAAVQAAADHGAPLEVRLAALLHDLGKPEADAAGTDHAQVGARLAGAALSRLRYPARVRRHVTRVVAGHAFRLDGPVDGRRARRFLAEHGERGARDLVELKAADLAAKSVPERELAALSALCDALERERESPHRLQDLAVDGNDLIAAGIPAGPRLGSILRALLDEVVEDPSRNRRAWLLARAAKESA
ncbi:HDIG domain-containing protein [Gaiella occulta]|uniref:HDIG domain-containing protein n=1 Tax=Gaiella occulta TaxID=1002870 RepID=A0A7M2YZL2_9ACTN|nr:HDIG domain-containing metalloprotein [Gaiella occulta]RDI75194.1 HDIG domain-containing protein [Gaiella occulta]